MAQALYSETERLRRIHRILVMFYEEKRSQADIAAELGISPATVNRMVHEGHERGLVEIRVKAPFATEADLAATLVKLGKLSAAIAVPTQSSDTAIVLKSVADSAAAALLDGLDDGQTIAVSGGVALCAVIDALNPQRRYDVRVVPATGGVQGKFRTDVNHVAVALAEKLGGTALQLHAPVFGASRSERDALLSVSTISGVLDVARKADVALFGIGSVLESGSTYLTLTDTIDRAELRRSDAAGELLAHLVNADGQLAGHPSNERLVAIGLDDLARIPRRIAVASGPTKAAPIAAVLRSGCVGTLVTDGRTAKEVIRKMRGTDDADAA
jgi:DNA-binding transcriptional regulator LsrR (DeoR family)